MGYSPGSVRIRIFASFYYLPSPHRCGKFVLNSSHSWDNCKLHNRQIHWIYLAGLVGFEPTNVGIKVPSVIHFTIALCVSTPMCLMATFGIGAETTENENAIGKTWRGFANLPLSFSRHMLSSAPQLVQYYRCILHYPTLYLYM